MHEDIVRLAFSSHIFPQKPRERFQVRSLCESLLYVTVYGEVS